MLWEDKMLDPVFPSRAVTQLRFLYEYSPLNLNCNLQANNELLEISQGITLSGLC